jgi:hypothetical protein
MESSAARFVEDRDSSTPLKIATTQDCSSKQQQEQQRRVHFAEELQIHLIESLFGHDLWFDQPTILAHARAESTWKLVHDETAQQYLDAYEEAFGTVVLEGRYTISSDLQEDLVLGVRQGHRVLERQSMVLYQRSLERKKSIRTILQMHRTLQALSVSSSSPEAASFKRNDAVEEQLRAYCDELSEASREWAQILARIDADAVSSLELFSIPEMTTTITTNPNTTTTTSAATTTTTTIHAVAAAAAAANPLPTTTTTTAQTEIAIQRRRNSAGKVRILRRRIGRSGILRLLPRRLLRRTKRFEQQQGEHVKN